jgi:hypothetical protein
VSGNCFASEMVKTTTLHLGNGNSLFTGEYGARIVAYFNGSNGNNIDFMTRTTYNGSFQPNVTIRPSGNVSIQNDLTVGGNITSQSLTIAGKVSGYITTRAPIYFTTNRIVSVAGNNYSAYDIDLNTYTKFVTLDGRKVRQFRLRCWLMPHDFETSPDDELRLDVFMSNYNQLSIRAYSVPYENPALCFVNNVSPTFFRNSFDIITYLCPRSLYAFHPTVYCIFEDLL